VELRNDVTTVTRSRLHFMIGATSGCKISLCCLIASIIAVSCSEVIADGVVVVAVVDVVAVAAGVVVVVMVTTAGVVVVVGVGRLTIC